MRTRRRREHGVRRLYSVTKSRTISASTQHRTLGGLRRGCPSVFFGCSARCRGLGGVGGVGRRVTQLRTNRSVSGPTGRLGHISSEVGRLRNGAQLTARCCRSDCKQRETQCIRGSTHSESRRTRLRGLCKGHGDLGKRVHGSRMGTCFRGLANIDGRALTRRVGRHEALLTQVSIRRGRCKGVARNSRGLAKACSHSRLGCRLGGLISRRGQHGLPASSDAS